MADEGRAFRRNLRVLMAAVFALGGATAWLILTYAWHAGKAF